VLIRPAYSLISSGTESAAIHQEGVLKEVANNPGHIAKILNVMKAQGPVRTVAEVMAKFNEFAVIGYSGAGYVAARHGTVTDLEVGQRVAYGGEGTGHGEVISTGRNLVARVPDGLGFDEACFATLGSIAMNGVRIAGIGLGERVVILGLGLVGQLIAQLVRLQGGYTIALDLREERIELARRLGAEAAFGGGDGALDGVLEASDGRGADVVIVAAAAKSPGPIQQALRLCRDRGRIVVVGAVPIELPWEAMYLKEIELRMSRAYGPGSYDAAYEQQGRDYPFPYVRWTENRNMEEFLRLCSSGKVNVQRLVTHRYALEQAPEAYEKVLDPKSGSLAVLLRYAVADSDGPPAAYQAEKRVQVQRKPLGSGEIGVALVGAGGLARWAHLPVIEKLQGVKLKGVHSASGARGRTYTERFGADYATSDIDDILQDPEIRVVLITSRNQHHARQALAALRAGKDVFVEKPMCLSEEECRELVEAVRSTGRSLAVGFNRRFAPYYQEFKKELSKRRGPAVMHCRVNSPGISGAYWMADPAIGGAILGEACHFVDLMRWVLDSDPVEVMAYRLPVGKQDPIGENNMAASFLFADGSVANLTYCTVGNKASGGERVEAFAPGIEVLTHDFKIFSTTAAADKRRGKIWPDKGYGPQLEAFFAAVRSGAPVSPGVIDGAWGTMGCLAMMESARDREPRDLRSMDWLS